MAETTIDGVVWNTYAVEFDHEDLIYSCNIWAKSFDHADEVLAALKATGQLVGRLEN